MRSPIDGRIGRMLVTPGNLVGPTTISPLATVVSVDPLYVYVDVDETRALRLSRAAGALARVGFAGEDGYPHQATLDFLDNREGLAASERVIVRGLQRVRPGVEVAPEVISMNEAAHLYEIAGAVP